MRTPVVQFGTSRFLQAHADLFIDEAGGGPITVVASSGGAAGRLRLAAFNDASGYPVRIRGMEDGAPVDRTVQVRSVVRAVDAEADWQDLVRIVCDEAEFIISNTTESGFAIPADLKLDLSSPSAEAPNSFPAKLLALLAARHAANGRPLVVLPTELISRNGDTLKRIVLDLARRSGGSAGLLQWIDEQCVFANSLVDRIVSEPIDPVGAVAEPYALWAIESQPGLRVPCEHPAIRVVDLLEPYERLKIHILNLGHTSFAERWMAAGSPDGMTVRVMLGDAEHRQALLSLYADEIVPGFAAKEMRREAEAYVETTLGRFANPFLNHRLADIAKNHRDKVKQRAAGFLAWIAASGTTVAMPRLTSLAAKYETEV